MRESNEYQYEQHARRTPPFKCRVLFWDWQFIPFCTTGFCRTKASTKECKYNQSALHACCLMPGALFVLCVALVIGYAPHARWISALFLSLHWTSLSDITPRIQNGDHALLWEGNYTVYKTVKHNSDVLWWAAARCVYVWKWLCDNPFYSETTKELKWQTRWGPKYTN